LIGFALKPVCPKKKALFIHQIEMPMDPELVGRNGTEKMPGMWK